MSRALARPLIAAWFVYDGVRNAVEPEARAVQAEPVVQPVLAELGVDVPTETVVRAHAVASTLAAVVLATSRTPRTAGLALTALTALQIAGGKRFWELPEGAERDTAEEDFVKNLSLLGGAMLAASSGHTERHIKRKKAKRAKAKLKAKELKVRQAEKARAERRFW